MKCPHCGGEINSKRPGYRGLYVEHVPMIEKMFRAGQTPAQIARAIPPRKTSDYWGHNSKATGSVIFYILRRLGHNVPKKTRTVPTAERNAQISKLVMDGLTLRAVGKQFSLSPTRVRQIVNREKRKAEPAS